MSLIFLRSMLHAFRPPMGAGAVIGVTLLTVLAAAALVASQAQAADRVLRLGVFVPHTHGHVREALIPWMERVNERFETEGYTIRLFSGGVLGRSARLQARLVRTGVLDLTWFVPGYTPGLFPNVELMELPLLHDDPEILTRAFWRMYERGLLPELDEVQALALSVSPAYNVHATFPVDDLGDLAGRKIRVVDASEAQMVHAMGGTPVAGIGANELAETLSRGLVDGVLFSWHAMGPIGVDRVTWMHIDHPLTFTPSIVAMNKRAFESLPEHLQRFLLETSGEEFSLAYTRSMLRGAVAARERAGQDEHRRFYTPSAQDRALIDAAIERMRQRWHQGDEQRLALIRAMEHVLAEIEAEETLGDSAPR